MSHQKCLATTNIHGHPLAECYGAEYHVERGANVPCGFGSDVCDHHYYITDHLEALVMEVRNEEMLRKD